MADSSSGVPLAVKIRMVCGEERGNTFSARTLQHCSLAGAERTFHFLCNIGGEELLSHELRCPLGKKKYALLVAVELSLQYTTNGQVICNCVDEETTSFRTNFAR
ncbi:unnamed protein product, partial [Sphacelaria rigidula]